MHIQQWINLFLLYCFFRHVPCRSIWFRWMEYIVDRFSSFRISALQFFSVPHLINHPTRLQSLYSAKFSESIHQTSNTTQCNQTLHVHHSYIQITTTVMSITTEYNAYANKHTYVAITIIAQKLKRSSFQSSLICFVVVSFLNIFRRLRLFGWFWYSVTAQWIYYIYNTLKYTRTEDWFVRWFATTLSVLDDMLCLLRRIHMCIRCYIVCLKRNGSVARCSQLIQFFNVVQCSVPIQSISA